MTGIDTKGSALTLGTMPDFFYGFEGSTPTSKKYTSEGIFNVKNFGALGNGVANDTTPIRNCFAAAWAYGVQMGSVAKGATVHFPPGSYLVMETITTASSPSASITIQGSGMHNTMIVGEIDDGFILYKPDTGGGQAAIYSIRDIGISNSSLVPDSGGLCFSTTGCANLENLFLKGMIALDAGQNQFQNRFANLKVESVGENQPVGSVGIVASDCTLIGCSVLGYETGYLIGGMAQGANAGAPGSNLIGCRVESCTIGFNLGANLLGSASSGAGVTMIGCQSERCDVTIVSSSSAPLSIIGGSYTATLGPPRYFHIEGGGSLKWSGGLATLTMPPAQPSTDDYGWTTGDRDMTVNGAEATYVTITNAVYNGGTGKTTFTTNALSTIGWTSGTRQLQISGTSPPAMSGIDVTGTWVNSTTFTVPMADPGIAYTYDALSPDTVSVYPGYNTGSNFVTATRTGARTFTYPVAVNPGGDNVNTWALWSFRPQSGLKLLGAQQALIASVSWGIDDPEIAIFDLTSFDGGFVTFQSTLGSMELPAGSKKAGIKIENCLITPSLGMVYADLPGQSGVWLNTYLTIYNGGAPLEGMEYEISDANLLTMGVSTGSSITSSTLTVGTVTSGRYSIGDIVSGTNVTAGSQIIAYGSGTTGGAGTYTLDRASTATSTTITAKNIPPGTIISAGGGSTHIRVRYNGTNWIRSG